MDILYIYECHGQMTLTSRKLMNAQFPSLLVFHSLDKETTCFCVLYLKEWSLMQNEVGPLGEQVHLSNLWVS